MADECSLDWVRRRRVLYSVIRQIICKKLHLPNNARFNKGGAIVETIKKYGSRAYWNNYIDSIIKSIKDDKDTILDMLVYGNLNEAEIIMRLSLEKHPSYLIKVDKIAEESPFGEEEEE